MPMWIRTKMEVLAFLRAVALLLKILSSTSEKCTFTPLIVTFFKGADPFGLKFASEYCIWQTARCAWTLEVSISKLVRNQKVVLAVSFLIFHMIVNFIVLYDKISSLWTTVFAAFTFLPYLFVFPTFDQYSSAQFKFYEGFLLLLLGLEALRILTCRFSTCRYVFLCGSTHGTKTRSPRIFLTWKAKRRLFRFRSRMHLIL